MYYFYYCLFSIGKTKKNNYRHLKIRTNYVIICNWKILSKLHWNHMFLLLSNISFSKVGPSVNHNVIGTTKIYWTIN